MEKLSINEKLKLESFIESVTTNEETAQALRELYDPEESIDSPVFNTVDELFDYLNSEFEKEDKHNHDKID